MKILGIIPARGGSKGIPRKNIKLLNGHPLIAYTIAQAESSNKIERTIISTDDEEIANIARQYGGDVPFFRPSYLATSKAPSLGFILHALKEMEAIGEIYEAVCLLQPTSPYRPSGIIDKAIDCYINSNKRTLVSVREIPAHFHPYWSFIQNGKGELTKNWEGSLVSRRQDLPKAFHRDGAIYLLDSSFMMETNQLLSQDIIGFPIDSPELINIDQIKDWEVAEKYLNYS